MTNPTQMAGPSNHGPFRRKIFNGTNGPRQVGRGPEPDRRDPLLRLLVLARPLRRQLLIAVVTGAAATGCGVALLAVSGFLLARASQHPNILAISVAVVAVRALSAGRGVFRYLERLASHDAAFRILADVRVSIYRRLERLAPAGARITRQAVTAPAPTSAAASGGVMPRRNRSWVASTSEISRASRSPERSAVSPAGASRSSRR